MFVQKSDFDYRPYNVPYKQLGNYDEHGTLIDDEMSEEFAAYVTEKEPEILKKLLGLKLYNEFTEALLEDYPDDKWLELRDGVEYEHCKIDYEWVGMRKLLIPYIFAMWLRDNFDNYDENGVTLPKVENAEPVDPALRIVTAWNKFYKMAGEGYGLCDYNFKNSLYGFLTVNKAEKYPDWRYTDVGAMNRFNL